MNTLNASQPFPSEASVSRFDSANELLEPELIAWIDRSTANASPVLEGCSGQNGWHDHGVSHGGRLEVKVGEDASFIFAEASPFDSYEHFGPGPFVNLRDEQGNEVICRVGGIACVPLDEWTSKLT